MSLFLVRVFFFRYIPYFGHSDIYILICCHEYFPLMIWISSVSVYWPLLNMNLVNPCFYFKPVFYCHIFTIDMVCLCKVLQPEDNLLASSNRKRCADIFTQCIESSIAQVIAFF